MLTPILRRLLCLALTLCLALGAGCPAGSSGSVSIATAPPATTAAATPSPTPVPVPDPELLAQTESLYDYFDAALYRDGMLLTLGGADGQLRLSLYQTETGAVAEQIFSLSGEEYYRIALPDNDRVVLAELPNMQLHILDTALTEQDVWSVSQEPGVPASPDETLLLSSGDLVLLDGGTLLLARTAQKQVETLCTLPWDNPYEMFLQEASDGRIMVCHQDALLLVSPENGNIQQLPLSSNQYSLGSGGAFCYGAFDTSLITLYNQPETPYLLHRQLNWCEQTLDGLILDCQQSKEVLTLTLLDLPGQQLYNQYEMAIGQDSSLFWSLLDQDAYYFLLQIWDSEQQRYSMALYRWDYRTGAEPTPLEVTPLTEETLSDLGEAIIADLEGTYGLRLCLEEEESIPLTDFGYVVGLSPALRYLLALQLSNLLEQLPPDLIPEMLTLQSAEELSVYFVSSIYPITDGSTNYPSALSGSYENGRAIVLSATSQFSSSDFFHELMHLLEEAFWTCGQDQGLDTMGYWHAFLPEGVDYAYSYVDEGGEDFSSSDYVVGLEEDPDRVYFRDSYSMTFPSEDRCRIFESLAVSGLEEVPPDWLEYPHLVEKARYLCCLLRTSYQSVAETDQVFWEQYLGEIPSLEDYAPEIRAFWQEAVG